MNLPDAIDSVADRPEPSEAQIKAGNYRKGPVSLHGMRISVENPQGSIRRGKSADGQPWASQLTHHYGYIRGAWGRDKDHLDIYLGPDAESADRVFVVDQMNPDSAKFDEHKVMLGFKDADDAREAYLDQFPEGWSGLGGVTELPLSSFKKWAFQKGRRVKPLSTEFAEATAQHYADGGSVEPQATSITDDMYAEALARFPARAKPHMGKRPEAHNNRAASAEMPLTAARAALATVLGTPGDLESLVRMITPGADEYAALPTTEFYREWLPTGGLDRTGPHGQLAEGVTDAAILATLPGPLTKLAGALRRGAARAGTKAADAVDSWRDSYIPRKADIDVILDRAGNILNPRPALPAYAEGGGVQAINDYSDAQYAAAREWAAGKTGAEVAAKGTELGLTADQFAKVLNNPAITGADVTANGYGTTGGLNAAYMNATYDAPGQFTNPAETFTPGTWQGGSGANAQELLNANAWSTGKTGAQIAAQAQAMGLTPEQMYQVFGQHQYGVGVGNDNMTWDGTQFVATPDTSYAPSAPQVSLPQTPPGPQAPPTPQPEMHAPTAYLQQTAAGNQSWRMGAPGAQTGWTAAPRFAEGGWVDADGNQMENWQRPGQFDSGVGFKLPNADASMNLSAEDFSKLQEYFARPDYDHTGAQGTGTPYYTDAEGYAWMPQRTGATLGPEGYYDPGMITGYYRGTAPGTDQTLTHGNVLRGFDMKGEHTGDWKHERESMWQTLAPILSVVAPALGGIFAPALSSLTSPVTSALSNAGLPSWIANAVPGAVGKGALSQLSGGNFWDGATGSFLGAGMGAGVDGMNLDPGTASIVKSLAGPALRGQNPLTPANLMKLAAPR